MAKSTSPHNGSGVLSAIQEFTAEFDLDEEGQVIEKPYLSSGTTPSPVPRSSAGSSEDEAQPFAAEIDSLRIALQRLQHAFSCTTTIEEHLKLAKFIPHPCGTSISRLVRTQNYLASNCVPEFNHEIIAALDVVIKECGHT